MVLSWLLPSMDKIRNGRMVYLLKYFELKSGDTVYGYNIE